jgi:hypothetical protein
MLHLFSSVALLAAGVLAGQTSAVVFHPDEQTRHPGLVADQDGHLHLTYLAQEKGKQVHDVFHAVSTDGGNTWGAAVEVSKTAGESSEPAIAGHGKDLAIVWIDTTAGADRPDVWAAVSTDAGAEWTAAVDVSKTPGVSSEPAVAVAPDGTIHVVWTDTTAGADHPDIWHTESRDHGKSWKAAEDISRTPGVSTHPAVGCGPKGEVYVAWADTTNGKDNRDIWFVRSLDGGKTWGKPFDMSNTPGLSSTPDLAVGENGDVYVAWIDSSVGATHPDVFVATSHDHGAKFGKPVDASKTPGISSEPAVVAVDGAVVAVWLDTSKDAKAPDIWIAQSANGGRKFSAAADLSNTPGVSGLPRVAVAAHSVVAVWEEEEQGAYHVKLARAPIERSGAKGSRAASKAAK